MATTRRAKAPARKGVRRHKLDMSKAKKKAEEIDQRSQSEYHELQQGWNYFFLLPPWSEEGVAWKEVERHGVHVCPKASHGRDCLVCKELNKRRKKGDTDFVDEWRSKPTGYFNAIRKADVKAKDPSAIKVLRCSPGVFGEIIDFITDEEIDITDPSAAHVLGIKRTGTGMRTRYKTKVSSEAVDISRYVTDEMIEGLFDLDAIRAVQPASDKDLRKIVRGAADDDEDDDDGFNDDEDDDALTDDDGDAEEAGDVEEDGDDELSDDEDGDVEDELFEDDEGGEEAEEGEEEAEEEEGDEFEEFEEEEEPPPPPRKKKVVKKASAKKAPAPAPKKKVRRRRA